MEERLIDKDELRGVKRKRTDGEEDVVDELSTDADMSAEEEGENYTLEFGGEEYDEDLVGLTPSQLKEELERRERLRAEAHEESLKHIAEGDEKFGAAEYRAAAEEYRAALGCEFAGETEEKLFAAITENYTNEQPLLERDTASEFSAAEEGCRRRVLDVFGDRLEKLRDETETEAQPLRERVSAAQQERRGPFAANRKYYLVRFLASLAALIVFAIGIAVSSSFLLRTQSPVPMILTITFGVLTFAAFVFLVYFSRKLLVAVRLCRDNEKLSSTEEGAQLAVLEERLACLGLVLGDEKPDEAGQEE